MHRLDDKEFNEIAYLLENLSQLEHAKQFFWQVLGYNPINFEHPMPKLPSPLRRQLTSTTLLGQFLDISVLFIHLKEHLPPSQMSALLRVVRAEFLFAIVVLNVRRDMSWVIALSDYQLVESKPRPPIVIRASSILGNRATMQQVIWALRTFDENLTDRSFPSIVQSSLTLLHVCGADYAAHWTPRSVHRTISPELWILNHEPLRQEEERVLFSRLQLLKTESGSSKPGMALSPECITIRNELTVRNLRFVYSEVRKFELWEEDLWDMFQEACIGLIIAVERFDVSLDFRLITYAIHWVRQRVKEAIYRNTLVRGPRHAQHTVVLFFGSDEFPETKVEEIDKSWDCDIERDDTLLNAIYIKELRVILLNSLQKLTKVQAHVIRRCFGLDSDQEEEPETLEVVAQQLGLTRERVRQIKEKALDRLRYHVKPELII